MTLQRETEHGDPVIPIYGAHPLLFEIERRGMDWQGAVIRHLDRILPPGRVLAGVRGARRVVWPGGLLAFVDSAGGDECCVLAPRDIAGDRGGWWAQGFQETILHTGYQFDSVVEASMLLSFYFGDDVGWADRKTEIG